MTQADLSRARYVEVWTGLVHLLDRQLSPLGLGAMDVLSPRVGETILDIGCGTGKTLMQLAERVGSSGQVVGVDILGELLAFAAARLGDDPKVRLIECDAALLDLPDASVDSVFSRFGVMAIDAPEMAFANFRRMTKRGGRLAFVCWRALEENEIDILPLRAAGLEHLVDRTPFRFEDADYVRGLLAGAGYRDIVVRAQDMAVSCGDVEETVQLLTGAGALGRIVRGKPEHKEMAEQRVREAIAGRVTDGAVFLDAATWVVSAVA